MEGWVDLGDLITPRPGIEPATAWSKVWRPNRCATKTHENLNTVDGADVWRCEQVAGEVALGRTADGRPAGDAAYLPFTRARTSATDASGHRPLNSQNVELRLSA